MFSTLIPHGRAAPSPRHQPGVWNCTFECPCAVSQPDPAPPSCSWLRRTKSTVKWTLLLLTYWLTRCSPANILILCDSVSGDSFILWLMVDLSRCDQETNQKISHLHRCCWKESQISQNQICLFSPHSEFCIGGEEVRDFLEGDFQYWNSSAQFRIQISEACTFNHKSFHQLGSSSRHDHNERKQNNVSQY